MPRSPFSPIPASEVIPPTRTIPEVAKDTVLAFLRTRQRPALAGAIKHGTRLNSASYVHQVCRQLAVEGRVEVFRKVGGGQLRYYKLAYESEIGPLFGSEPSGMTAADVEERLVEVATAGDAPARQVLTQMAEIRAGEVEAAEREVAARAADPEVQRFGFCRDDVDKLRTGVELLARSASARLAQTETDRALGSEVDGVDESMLTDARNRLLEIHRALSSLRHDLEVA